MHVLVAMSGGVDSAVAAALLRDAGHRVTSAFLRTGVEPAEAAKHGRQGCCGIDDAADAARVAGLLDIPFYSLDFAADFDGLIDDFAAEYSRGRTPNPCIACNRDLKFGRLLRFASAIGADVVATGHYARVEEHGGRMALRIPSDRRKDQTYVLFPLSQEQLRRTVFPLGGLTKSEVRALAAERGLPVSEKPESMEICFVPGGDYRAVLAERAPEALEPGDLVDSQSGERLGRHAGVGSVTIGQRRGLGIATPEPRYVTRIDPETRRVFVGPADDLETSRVHVSGWNPVAAAMPGPGDELVGSVRIRRNHDPASARLVRDGDGLLVEFEQPVRAPAPGQALVLYDDHGYVLGGGWIAGRACSTNA